MLSRIPELQEAVRALRGVQHASVRWPEPGGPATLHVVFEEAGDRDEATLGVLETLRQVGDVDLSTVHVHLPPPPAPAAPSAEGAWPATVEATSRGQDEPGHDGVERPDAVRPVFSGLTVERTDLDNAVTVTLRLGERVLRGRAEGLATRRASPRTAAAAALLALQEALPRDTRVQLEWLELVPGASAERPPVLQAAVTCLTAAGEETYIGSAMVREDPREAAVRATLDALNRRLERLLVGDSPPARSRP